MVGKLRARAPVTLTTSPGFSESRFHPLRIKVFGLGSSKFQVVGFTVLVGHVDVKPGVRAFPFERGDLALDSHFQLEIEFRLRVMGPGSRRQHETDAGKDRQERQTRLHRAYDS